MDLEVGSVGLGLMGRPMASNLVAAGVKAQGLQSHGIEGAPLIGGTAERSYGPVFGPTLRISLRGAVTRAPSPMPAAIFAIESPTAAHNGLCHVVRGGYRPGLSGPLSAK
jgi:hypothetical protein